MQNSKRKKVLLIIVITFIILSSLTFTLGKYIYNSIWDYYLKSQDFYFGSDDLGYNCKNHSNLEWDGNNIEFNLKNYLNDGLITKYDIKYKVTCEVIGVESEYLECNIDSQNTNTYEGSLSGYETCINNKNDNIDVSSMPKSDCEIKGYDWIEEPSLKKLNFNIISKDASKNIKNVSVQITAESLSPYHKVLIGKYNLHRIDLNKNEIISQYKNYVNYDMLTISNTSMSDKCLRITWNSNELKVDDKNKFLETSADSNNYINNVKIKVNSKSNSIIKYFKSKTDKIFNIDDVSINEEDCN